MCKKDITPDIENLVNMINALIDVTGYAYVFCDKYPKFTELLLSLRDLIYENYWT